MTTVLLDLQNLNQKPKICSSCVRNRVDEKSNVFVEPQAQTKTPRKVSVSSTALSDLQENMGSLTTPTKGKELPACEPWTPTSNLKMLISAASPEIRNREKELSVDNPETPEATDSSQEPIFGDEADKLHISRKEKSLGLLCHKFLARYPDYPNPAVNNDICLDDVAGELNVERRRIYDIMNVLESLHMVGRLAKNRYTWHGRANLRQTLATLMKVGEEHKYSEQMQQIKQKGFEREFDFDGEEKENEDVHKPKDRNGDTGQKEMFFVEIPGVEFRAASVNSRKDKSLRVMSQKFVMLFLVSRPRVVSLEVAARILIGEDQVIDLDKSKFKTKIRRLYDIANVLSSLELIKKVHVTEERGRKPAFKWTGPEDFASGNADRKSSSTTSATVLGRVEPISSVENCAKNLFPTSGAKHSFTRHPSLVKLAKSIQEDRRKINSAPTSPAKHNESSAERYPNKMAHLAAICQIQLDKQSKKVKGKPILPHQGIKPVGGHGFKNTDETDSVPPKQNPTKTNQTQPPVQTGASMPLIPSPILPVLLSQHQVGTPYAVYIQQPARPEPSSLAMRCMTFEDKVVESCGSSSGVPVGKELSGSQRSSPGTENPHLSGSPEDRKRTCMDRSAESSPKVRKTQLTSKAPSPHRLSTVQAYPKSRRSLVSSRPSPRALHLDPEFVNTPESMPVDRVDQSVEMFLEKEEKVLPATPLRTVPLQEVLLPQGTVQTETLIPTGYLIPISQQSVFSLQDAHGALENTKLTVPSQNIFHTPTAGAMPTIPPELKPASIPFQVASSASALSSLPMLSPLPCQRLHSPSPAILNFTLQNLGLIPACSPSQAPVEQISPNHLAFQQRGMIFVKPMSPMPLQHQAAQPLTVFSLQQPLIATPKGTQPMAQSFFHTPVSTLGTPSGHQTTVYIPQRKLNITPEDN